jgi:hypothetical protein
MPSPRSLAVLLAGLVALASPAAAGDLRLLMLWRPGCEWCALWDEEVGTVYERTAEGRAAPLIRARIHGPLPEGVALARPGRYTPTFVLLENGEEVGRIEGYPGEEFFYGMLGKLLERAGHHQGGETE